MTIESESPEIWNIELSGKDFKITMLNIFYKETVREYNQILEFLKNQMEILELKNTINKIKNTFGKLTINDGEEKSDKKIQNEA